ncbi:MAG: 30S ribosome-binding factor RbfA [Patescibacteria group bacterium]
MKHHRSERVASLIKEELGKILIEELEMPPGVLLTITEVFVTNKLENAKIMVSIYPSSESGKFFEILKKKQGELQFILSRKMNIRPMPRIEFEIDLGPERAARVEKRLMENQ